MTGSEDGQRDFYNGDSGTQRRPFKDEEGVQSVKYSSDGRHGDRSREETLRHEARRSMVFIVVMKASSLMKKKVKYPCGHVDYADANAAFKIAKLSISIDQSFKDRVSMDGREY